MELSRDHGDLCSTGPSPTPAREAPPAETAHSRSPWCRPAHHPHPRVPPPPVSSSSCREGGRPRDRTPAMNSRVGRALSLRSRSSCAVSAAHPDTPCLQGSPNPAALGAPPDRREGRELPEETRGPAPPAPLPSGIREGQAPAAAHPLPRQANNTPRWGARASAEDGRGQAPGPRVGAGWPPPGCVSPEAPWGPRGGLRSLGPSCCGRSLRKRRPVSVTSSGRKASAVLQSGSPPTRRPRGPALTAQQPDRTGEGSGARSVLSRSPQCESPERSVNRRRRRAEQSRGYRIPSRPPGLLQDAPPRTRDSGGPRPTPG